MSLLSLSKSLGKIFSYCHTIPDQEDYKSTKNRKKTRIFDKNLDFIFFFKPYKKNRVYMQLQVQERRVFKTKHRRKTITKLNKNNANKKDQPVPESILKLLIITYLNQSIYYEKIDLAKAMISVISAKKISEKHKFTSFQGKLLVFVSNLRECELCIFNKKYTLGISCAQNVLRLVMTKLEKPHKKRE
jgi:hypothetical protein